MGPSLKQKFNDQKYDQNVITAISPKSGSFQGDIELVVHVDGSRL